MSVQSSPGEKDSLEVVREFVKLSENAVRLLESLRDVPSRSENWRSAFNKAFDMYVKLWQIQMQNRKILEDKNNYGLKRWEIGNIASKIGQLYYHYYLRTSKTECLRETLSFYKAIRSRKYFGSIDCTNGALYTKKLKYYTRFITVCLLLDDFALADKLEREMDQIVVSAQESPSCNEPNCDITSKDLEWWRTVVEEIREFIDSMIFFHITDAPNTAIDLPPRVIGEDPLKNIFSDPGLYFNEALLLGYHKSRAKFSELTTDTYRMMHLLECEPLFRGESRVLEPPKKFVFYRPPLYKILSLLSVVARNAQEDSVCLLYLSAPGKPGKGLCIESNSKHPEDAFLHPSDLEPFLRRHFLIIIDSESSSVMSSIKQNFKCKSMILMSPENFNVKEISTHESMSLFFYSPGRGFALLSGIKSSNKEMWTKCIQGLQDIEAAICSVLKDAILSGEGVLDDLFSKLFKNIFLRRVLVRYILMWILIACHKSLNAPENYPRSVPEIPKSILNTEEILSKFSSLINLMGLQNVYEINTDRW